MSAVCNLAHAPTLPALQKKSSVLKPEAQDITFEKVCHSMLPLTFIGL